MKKPRDLAPAVSRAILVLDALARAPRQVALGDLATSLKLPKSSVFGICSSLLAGGLIERGEDGAFTLGLRIIDLANARLGQNDLAQEFMRFWAAHPEFRDEAAILSERHGKDVIYLACRNSTRPLGVTFRVGMRLSAAFTATGKAILSTLPDGEVEELYARKGALQGFTDRSVRSVTALKRQLKEFRRLGYSIDDGETREGMCSFGAAVMDRSGASAGAGVALSFFRADLDEQRTRQAIATVKELAIVLSRKAASLNSAG
ncbi:MAG: IclR family transcriptional regulator [Betaproteobacteria bacterium]|nr:IclR family transcriptional regulator [Betaproteobacteria bacterium]